MSFQATASQTVGPYFRIGVEPLYMAPAPLGEFVRSERVKWGAVIQAANIRTE